MNPVILYTLTCEMLMVELFFFGTKKKALVTSHSTHGLTFMKFGFTSRALDKLLHTRDVQKVSDFIRLFGIRWKVV